MLLSRKACGWLFVTSLALVASSLASCSLSDGTETLRKDEAGGAGASGQAGSGSGGSGGRAGATNGSGGSSQGAGGSGGTAGVGGAGGGSGQSGGSGAGGGASSAYAQLVLSDNPVAFYRFDDEPSSGALVSLADGGPKGVVQGASLQRVPGALLGDPSTAAKFVDSGVLLGNAFPFAPGSAFTFEFWFKPEAPLSEQFPKLFSKYAAESQAANIYAGYYFIVRTEGVSFTFEPANAPDIVSVSAAAVPTDEYTYVAVTSANDGENGALLYVNGQQVNKLDFPLASTNAVDSVFLLGEGPDTERFRGTIDEFAVYKKALTPAAIAAHHTLGRQGPPAAR